MQNSKQQSEILSQWSICWPIGVKTFKSKILFTTFYLQKESLQAECDFKKEQVEAMKGKIVYDLYLNQDL